MVYDFDLVHDRKNTASVKWDMADSLYGERGLLPLWVADMDFRSPEPVVRALAERVSHGIFGYSFCDEEYFMATMEWLRLRHDWSVEREWIVPVPGVVPSLNMAVQEFTSPGDSVLIQQPVYYPFMKAVANNGRAILNNSLVLEKGGYEIDFQDFEEKASRPGTRLFILCSPHNPVGRVWRTHELEALGEICLRHGVLVISDEIHCDLVFSGHRHIPLASISAELAENTITCHAPSKTFNLPGLHMSYMIISSENLRSDMNKRLSMNGIFGPDIMGPAAQTAACRYGAEWLDQVMVYIEANYKYTAEFFAKNIPAVDIIRPEATYLLWLDFRGLGFEAEALKSILKKEARLALNQGDLYGPEGRGFLRMNIACPRSILEEALWRLKKCFGAKIP